MFYDDLVHDIEIIDLESNSSCEKWPDLSIPVKGATGGFLNGGVLVCGGNTVTSDVDASLTDRCQHITPDGTQLSYMDLSIPTIASSSTVVSNRLLVSGGVSPYYVDNAELIDLEHKWPVPNLPYKVADHCSMLIGNVQHRVTYLVARPFTKLHM